MEAWQDELYHYGVKGMKWGVRRYQNEDGSYTSLGKKRRSDDAKKAHNGIHLSEKQKKYLKIGAAVVGSGLLIYGAYQFNKVNTLNVNPKTGAPINSILRLNDSNRSKYLAGKQRVFELFNGKIDSNTGFRIINKPNKIPKSDKEIVNPFYWINDKFRRNCGNSVIANELRDRGFDVGARGNSIGMTKEQLFKCFGGFDEKSVTEINPFSWGIPSHLKYTAPDLSNFKQWASSYKARAKYVKSKFVDTIKESQPNGSRGAIFITLAGANGESGPGHWFSWYKDAGGNVRFANPQKFSLSDLNIFGQYTTHSNGPNSFIVRLDNLKVDSLAAKEYVRNKGFEYVKDIFTSGSLFDIYVDGKDFVMKMW